MNVDSECDRPYTPPSSLALPPSSPSVSMIVGSQKNSSANLALSMSSNALDTRTVGGGLVRGAVMDVDLPVDGTTSGSEDAISKGMTGAGATGGGTVGMSAASGGMMSEVTMGGDSMTGDSPGTSLFCHEGDLVGGSVAGKAGEGSTVSVKLNMGLHVSA